MDETYYVVDGYRGVAWYRIGDGKTYCEDHEEMDHCDPDPESSDMVMVGDDRVFNFETSEITPVPDDDFCHECGQIGCKVGGIG